jgi:hypothetical protein
MFKKLLISIFAAICIANHAHAGLQEGIVTNLYIRASDHLIYFELSGANSSKPACAQQSYWMIRDENSLTGKQQLASILLAWSMGKRIRIQGAGTCLRWYDGEDVEMVILL